MSNMVEYEAQDSFDKKWYPAHVLTGEIVNGKIKIEWTTTGWISWVEPERLRICPTKPAPDASPSGSQSDGSQGSRK